MTKIIKDFIPNVEVETVSLDFVRYVLPAFDRPK